MNKKAPPKGRSFSRALGEVSFLSASVVWLRPRPVAVVGANVLPLTETEAQILTYIDVKSHACRDDEHKSLHRREAELGSAPSGHLTRPAAYSGQRGAGGSGMKATVNDSPFATTRRSGICVKALAPFHNKLLESSEIRHQASLCRC